MKLLKLFAKDCYGGCCLLVFKAGKYNLTLGKKTYVMGLLNVTPNSFSDGGKYFEPDLAIERAFEIEAQGADIIDIGAHATSSHMPAHIQISPEEELERLIPILKKIQGKLKIPISIDTFYPKVAAKTLEFGVNIINDVNGFRDENMWKITKKSDCGMIIMHNFNDMNIVSFFKKQLFTAISHEINSERLCFDPGIGFGKSKNENSRENDMKILANIDKFKIKNNAFLVGASRKRVIGEQLNNLPIEERLYGTISAHSIAAFLGADIIRVHDVKEAVHATTIVDKIKNIRN